jgi:hypothetical protein
MSYFSIYTHECITFPYIHQRPFFWWGELVLGFARQAGSLPLEPLRQSFFVLGTLEMGSH